MPRRNPAQDASPIPTRERLLDAAAEVFAREGLKAATTREIAQAASINEVTLFRLFKSKRNLLAAVLERVFSPPVKAQSVATDTSVPGNPLAAIVREFAQNYSARLNRNPTLIRVLVGEIQHFQEHELKVIQGIFRPDRQALIGRLRAAAARGLVRKDADPVIVADQISAIVFMGELRRALPLPKQCGSKHYLEECVETIVRGIESPSPVGRNRKA